MQLSSKNDDSSLMTSSLRIKIFKIDKSGDFSRDIDYYLMAQDIIYYDKPPNGP